MTIEAWICFSLIAIFVMAIAIGMGYSNADLNGAVVGGLVGLIVCSILLGALLWKFNYTESGKRAMKTQRSELLGGIERSVRVYDVQGDLITEYEGKFDIDYDAERIIFDDENGKRHIIYFSTATVVIDEQ